MEDLGNTVQAVDWIIRISFKSGGVSEERGSEWQVSALFDEDDERLIDHVVIWNPITGEQVLWHHEEDMRWEDLELRE